MDAQASEGVKRMPKKNKQTSILNQQNIEITIKSLVTNIGAMFLSVMIGYPLLILTLFIIPDDRAAVIVGSIAGGITYMFSWGFLAQRLWDWS